MTVPNTETNFVEDTHIVLLRNVLPTQHSTVWSGSHHILSL